METCQHGACERKSGAVDPGSAGLCLTDLSHFYKGCALPREKRSPQPIGTYSFSFFRMTTTSSPKKGPPSSRLPVSSSTSTSPSSTSPSASTIS